MVLSLLKALEKPFRSGDTKRIKRAGQAYEAGIQRAEGQYDQLRQDQMRNRDQVLGLFGDSYAQDIRRQGGLASQRIGDALFNEGGVERALSSSPGYQQALDAGSRAIQGNAALRGLQGSGYTARALSDHAQDTANNYFDRHLSRLGAVQQAGYTAEDRARSAQAGYGVNFANLLQGVTNREADLSLGRGQALADTQANILAQRSSNRNSLFELAGSGLNAYATFKGLSNRNRGPKKYSLGSEDA